MQTRTFFVTTITAQRRRVFQVERMAQLFLDTVFSYRDRQKFQVHEFVLMPDHFHALITPAEIVSLEKALQFIKGGFSFRAKRELNYTRDIWEPSFTNHRIRNASDYEQPRKYILDDPRKAGLDDDYPYSSVHSLYRVDSPPPGLKPSAFMAPVSPA